MSRRKKRPGRELVDATLTELAKAARLLLVDRRVSAGLASRRWVQTEMFEWKGKR